MKGLRGLGSNTLDSTKYKYLCGQINSRDIFGEDNVSTGSSQAARTFTQLMQLVRSAMNMQAMLKQCD